MSRYLLFFLGARYSILGIWAIVDIHSFSLFLKQQDYFLQYSNAVLSLSLGLLFLWYALQNNSAQSIIVIAILVSCGMALVEFLYIPTIGSPFPFMIDFGVQCSLVILFILALIRKRQTV